MVCNALQCTQKALMEALPEEVCYVGEMWCLVVVSTREACFLM